MSGKLPTSMQMPEILVFARAMLFGAVLFETLWVAYLGAVELGRSLAEWGVVGWLVLVGYAAALPIVFVYAKKRGCLQHALRIIQSRRIDLLLLFGLGAFVMYRLDPLLAKFHEAVSHADILWAPTAFAVLMLTFISPIWRELRQRKRPDTAQLWFLADEEISRDDQDALGAAVQATNFANTVLASVQQSGLVFGIDGPWGVGKSSFLNLAKQRWEDAASDTVIVFRFEPLRYASEPDLSERFIKDLCAAIRQKVFAPELLPVASRYSRILKGKTDLSVFGIKFSLEPSSETIDELLEDIDDLLKQLDRRLIVIVDDLDRLESKLVNNVLFTVRRTFKLSQATYILCYDTENLLASTAGKDDGARAREFLEKFITAKLSLFVDLKSINDFLDTDWEKAAFRSDSVSPTVMRLLRQIMKEVQTLLASKNGHRYVPLLGDLRKIKRFVNAALLMNMEKVKLDDTDFDIKDLIHLMLLNLNYPGLFRQIYAAETEGRTGSFGVQRKPGESNKLILENATGLAETLNKADEPAKFLLQQLFDVDTLRFSYTLASDENVLRSRACFNGLHRNLENYLQLIVRLKIPEPTKSHRLYKDLVESVIAHKQKVAGILLQSDFSLRKSETPHDEFWSMLVNRAHELNRDVANDAINTLVEWLPNYSSLEFGGRSMRHRTIISLMYLLERAGFGDLPGNGRIRGEADVQELAVRLIGNGASQSSPPLIWQLVTPERGVLGWSDLMLLRMCCSPDVNFNTNICTALARQEDPCAKVFGVDHDRLAVDSMRRFSQSVFAEFKRFYIDRQLNFFLEVDRLSEAQILGKGGRGIVGDIDDLEAEIQLFRSDLKSFVIYHLTNIRFGNAQGVGCGRYDEFDKKDGQGIRQAMTDYLLESCFDPSHGLPHAQAFADFCLRPAPFKLTAPDGVDDTLYTVTDLLGKDAIANFWGRSGEQIKQQLASVTGAVYGYGRRETTYEDWLPTLFAALDQLVKGPEMSAQDE
nr:P-loop NTPase fold protein [uncultured Rhodoferax sp.]